MPSDEFGAVLEVLRSRATSRSGSLHDLEARRQELDLFDRLYPMPGEMETTGVDVGGVPSTLITPPGAHVGRLVVYLHGGGYCRGSAKSHGALAARIAGGLGVPVLVPEYRLAPEHPFPAAVEDAVAVCAGLTREPGPDGASFALAGDSAGGGLALAAMVAIRDQGGPLPTCAALLSPWVELETDRPVLRDGAGRDPVLTLEDLELSSRWYLDGHSPDDPLASPLRTELSGLPAILIQVGTAEVLLDDALSLEAAARQAGTPVEMEVAQDMVHVWQLYGGVPEADAAVARVAAFIGRHW